MSKLRFLKGRVYGEKSAVVSLSGKSAQTTTVQVPKNLSTTLGLERERRRWKDNVDLSKGDLLYEAFVFWLKAMDRAAYDEYVDRGLIQ